MKIAVYAPPFCDHAALDREGQLELKEGASLRDALRALKIPPLLRPLLIIRVNYEKSAASRPLKHGDTVTIFWPLSGG